MNEPTTPIVTVRPAAERDPHLLVVGGTARNVGKTEMICRLIDRCAHLRQGVIVALKVSAVYPDELLFHGSHDPDEPPFQLFEETDRSGTKDTCRMLRAGARRVFYLRCQDSDILPAYRRFRKILPEATTIICESNSLADFIRPGLLVMVTSPSGTDKARAIRHLARADLVVVSDGSSGFPDVARVTLDESGAWQLVGD
ncbi:hypothetical protein [Desulfofustis glycolicus]|uniref:Uncharacterized protein n=1 Tax=Desulfofustis glycolicus DSM 9705 TaxID=1121409 RepID=A0A1M5SZN2_9BACT|nr:hypothetical protein [Desulfofustis glycolicus]SHH43949.1 hypothetical protein SAMN02745124_00523 [Desulfofustis glycolicus DSM 9705]